MDCEVLLADDLCVRGRKMLEAMIAAAPVAGVNCIVGKTWQDRADALMSYGLGHPVRRGWTDAHKRRGGRLVGWDLGYWERDVPLRFNMRLTIDDDHPHRWIRPESPERFDAAGIDLREDYDRRGPIVLCGMGRKQRSLKGYRGQEWELRQLQRLRRLGPVVYRPKRAEPALPGCKTMTGDIADAIRGASLVVCGHSNVAIDGCIAGVPVQCEDGAAFALYRDNPAPTRAQRLDFLRSLAWWQWNPTEALQAWAFLRRQLCA